MRSSDRTVALLRSALWGEWEASDSSEMIGGRTLVHLDDGARDNDVPKLSR